MTPLWSLILAVMAVAFCLGIYQAMQEAPHPKIRPLSDDDKALQAHFEKVEKDRQERARNAREATRRHYEGITWPAICWAYRERQMQRHFTVEEMTA